MLNRGWCQNARVQGWELLFRSFTSHSYCALPGPNPFSSTFVSRLIRCQPWVSTL